jgi:hypothetical protein
MRGLAALCALLAAAAPARAQGGRALVDEVVAVVAAHSITLSEVRAEALVQLVLQHGAEAAGSRPDRQLLAATLQRMIDQRLVLSEVESLRGFELDRNEVEAELIRFRARFGTPDRYQIFCKQIDLTDDEIGQLLARQIRYLRYIDSKAKLAGELRKTDLEEQCGKSANAQELAACTRRLQIEHYRKVTEDVLSELKKRVDVRIVDPLFEGAG